MFEDSEKRDTLISGSQRILMRFYEFWDRPNAINILCIRFKSNFFFCIGYESFLKITSWRSSIVGIRIYYQIIANTLFCTVRLLLNEAANLSIFYNVTKCLVIVFFCLFHLLNQTVALDNVCIICARGKQCIFTRAYLCLFLISGKKYKFDFPYELMIYLFFNHWIVSSYIKTKRMLFF